MKIFSFDGETNGLYGQAFALAAVVTDDSGEIATFVARCPIEDIIDDWVAENVLPNMENVGVTHADYRSMLESFWNFYMKHKEGADVVAHVAHPVETKLFRDVVEANLNNRIWEAPFPLIDVASVLKARGFDPLSVDSYIKSQNLEVPFDGTIHHPLYDSWATEVAYRHLMRSV